MSRANILTLAIILSIIPTAHTAWGVDVGACECRNPSTINLNGTAHGDVGLSVAGVTVDPESPTPTVCAGQWFVVDAIGGGDCDIGAGQGDNCLACGTPSTASCSYSWFHNDKNVDVPYLWEVDGEDQVMRPLPNEEIDREECPYYNYDTDPFIWIKAPMTSGTISVCVSRAENTLRPDANGDTETVEIQVLCPQYPVLRTFGYTAPLGAGDVAILEGKVATLNESLLNEEDDGDGGPFHQYDSNYDYQIANPDQYIGGFDVNCCKAFQYELGEFWDFQCSKYGVPAFFGETPWEIEYGANIYQVDNWLGSLPEGTVLVVPRIYEITDPGPPLRISGRINGYAPCNSSKVIIVKYASARDLLHEFGHNAGHGHVRPLSTSDPNASKAYTMNIMSYQGDGSDWLNATTINAFACSSNVYTLESQWPF